MKKSMKLCFYILTMVLAVSVTAQAATVGYWEFDGDDPVIGKDAVGNHDFIPITGVVGASGLRVDPVPNPDATLPFDGQGDDSASNPKATWFTSGDAMYVPNDSDPALHDDTFDLDPTKSFTIEGWFRPYASGLVVGNQHASGTFPGTGQLGNNFKGWRVNTLGGGSTLAFHLDGAAGGGSAVELNAPSIVNELQHFAGVMDVLNGEIRLYIDGDLKDTAPIPAAWGFHRGGALAVGARDLGDGTFASLKYAGAIDELRYSDDALAPNEFLNAPEPASLTLMSLGLLAVIRRKRS